MGLLVETLHLKDFRNYADLHTAIDPRLTILVGPNAVGKTNIVEALHLLTAIDSFRHPRWEQLVRWGQDEARAELTAGGDGRKLEIRLDVAAGTGRQYHVNGRPRRRLVDLTGIIPSVAFTPDDLLMVKGSSAIRRGTIDELGDQMSEPYATLRREYARILKQRNALLKTAADQAQIDPWDEQLIEVGSRLMDHRRNLAVMISAEATTIYSDISRAEPLEVRYVPSWERDSVMTQEPRDTRDAFSRALELERHTERRRAMTVVGPHRDDIIFSLAGKEARAFASQGQQRSIALAWKLAEVVVMERVNGSPPLLLLDDVMSELDESRRRELTGFVSGRVQTVVTTTNLQYFTEETLAAASVVELSHV